MSVFLNEVAVTAFDEQVKQSYQGDSRLHTCVTTRNNVTGEEYRFQQIGKGMAHERTAPSSDSIPMNITYSKTLVQLIDWDADEYTDLFMKKEVNFDEVRELAQVIKKALGRRIDQTIIDAVQDARASLVSIGNIVLNGGTGLDLAKLTATAQLMDDLEIDEEDRVFVGTTKAKQQLLNTTEATSADYASVKALVNGQINTFMGFTFKWIGKREEGGMTVNGDIADCFAFHKASIGSAYGIEPNTTVDWVPQKKSHLSAGQMKMGSIVRDLEGVFIVEVDETAVPTA